METYRRLVEIEADAASVLTALTTTDGVAGWWAVNCSVGNRVGDSVAMKFDKGGTVIPMTFRIESVDNACVEWTCTDNGNPVWIGTTLSWTLTVQPEATALSFEHAGWGDRGVPEPISTTWDHFLASLKAYVETGTGQPWS